MIITDTHVYFWGGIYSNWFPVKIVDPNTQLEFSNTEQAFMWHKAKHFGDTESCEKIKSTTNPMEVKKLGRLVKNYNDDEWAKVRVQAMCFVNYLKFIVDVDLRNELLSTRNRVIVEASPYDLVWGVGLLEDDPLIFDEKNWKGQNLLGKVLMNIRNDILCYGADKN